MEKPINKIMVLESLDDLFNPLIELFPRGVWLRVPVTAREKDHILALATSSGHNTILLGVIFAQEASINYIQMSGINYEMIVAPVHIPQHIQAMADVYVSDGFNGEDLNFSDGRIERIYDDEVKVGHYYQTLEEQGRYYCTWVSLGNHYFKLLKKVCA
jgi:hypothetical protein